MAKVKFGMMMTDARGKLGGQVFTKNRSGAVVRTKVTPVNPQSVAQALARSILASNSSAWANLSEEDRLGWIAAADNVVKTNIFGDNYKPSGKNHFVGVNANLRVAGLPPITVAPEPIAPGQILSLTSTYASATGAFGVVFDIDREGPQGTLVLKATRPSSAGKYNFSGQYVVISTTATDEEFVPADLGLLYEARFGRAAAGTKIGIEAYIISESGIASPPAKTTVISI